AGLRPKNDESPTGQARGLKAHGKRRSTRMRKGAPWLKTTLVQCAWAAARKKASYLQAQFHRPRARRGAKKAIGALAASILTIVYNMLISGEFERGATRSANARTNHRVLLSLPSNNKIASSAGSWATAALSARSPRPRDCVRGFGTCKV